MLEITVAFARLPESLAKGSPHGIVDSERSRGRGPDGEAVSCSQYFSALGR